MNCWPRLPCRHSRLLSPQLQQARRLVSLSDSPSAVSFPPAMATFARDSSLLFPHSINGRRGPLTQRPSPCAANLARADPATLPGPWTSFNASSTGHGHRLHCVVPACLPAFVSTSTSQLLPSKYAPDTHHRMRLVSEGPAVPCHKAGDRMQSRKSLSS